MTTRTILISAVAAIFVALSGQSAAANGVDLAYRCGVTGSIFNRGECAAYIDGAVEAILEMNHPNICFPRNYDMRQSIPIVQNYMRNHPARLNAGPATVIRDALRVAYPC